MERVARSATLDQLPPRISDPAVFASFADILAVRPSAADTARLRLRLIDGKVSWQALTDFALGQDAIFPLIWALRRRSLLLPVPRASRHLESVDHPTSALEALYDQHLARRRAQRDQLIAIIAALNQAGIVALVLKGARYLLAPQGPWCEARSMRDIDLLVRKDDAQAAVAALERQGYASDAQFVPMDQHLPELWMSGRPSAVEIHTEALAFSARKTLATDEVWQRAVRLSTEAGAFFVLPVEWHLLHGLLNHQLSDRGHARCLLALKALWEFALLGCEMSEEAWRSIDDHMNGRGQADVLGSWIVQAARLFGLGHPPGGTISSAARAHAEQTLAHAARPDWLRRGHFLAAQLRFGFARETMAVRYGLVETEVSPLTAVRHLRFLARYYRGQVLRRLMGRDAR
jgi:hypothetical protein